MLLCLTCLPFEKLLNLQQKKIDNNGVCHKLNFTRKIIYHLLWQSIRKSGTSNIFILRKLQLSTVTSLNIACTLFCYFCNFCSYLFLRSAGSLSILAAVWLWAVFSFIFWLSAVDSCLCFLAAMSSVYYPPFLFLASSSGSVLPATEVASGLPSLFVHHLSVSLTPQRSEIRGSPWPRRMPAPCGGGGRRRPEVLNESFLVVPARLNGY